MIDLEAKVHNLLSEGGTKEIEIDFNRDGVAIDKTMVNTERTSTLEELLDAV